ncbi:hypothetical protein MNB_SV-6-687 [hydrothermal vent metagenome]|uniref:Lipoprotein n=1 Tax=hydrothermal vent metagenome TaxID=652676 RepID=A0A1W1BUA6_9ZZZZ
MDYIKKILTNDCLLSLSALTACVSRVSFDMKLVEQAIDCQ